MRGRLPGSNGSVEIIWDKAGFAHVFATDVGDAYRGLGYAAASERLWQIHQSTAYANGEAAALLGPRFIGQDLLQRACNVDGRQTGVPASDGDWLADAYLDGMNAFIDGLDEVPPEFRHAGAEPRRFTRNDIAARYRFTSWFQHKSWAEKMILGRLMATHGVEWFRGNLLRFSDEDAQVVRLLQEPLRNLDLSAVPLAYPEAEGRVPLSGSNNWAVTGALSASGTAMLASDPHQPHSIPNTFFYAHLHAGDFDVFGAGFPGVPYFMMGRTPDIAWGLTTGFVDSYDVYIEQVQDDACRTEAGWRPLTVRNEDISVRGASPQSFELRLSPHGPLLESIGEALDSHMPPASEWRTALRWALADVPTSAGALARLPLAKTAREFGDALFEENVCPLVNNIICVDRHDGLERYIATTLPVRTGVTGMVPLPGWLDRYDFERSRAADLVVEVDPPCAYTLTANNDTLGAATPYPIHNFPANSARADRIRELLEGRERFTVEDFKVMQLDLLDLQARATLAQILPLLRESDDADAAFACRLLETWDCRATADSAAACIYYPFLDRFWPRRFMRAVLDDEVLALLPAGAQSWRHFDVDDFLYEASPWLPHKRLLADTVRSTMADVVRAVRSTLGEDPAAWRWGDLHQVAFAHRLSGEPDWAGMQVGPDALGGSANTLNMALHTGPGPGRAKPGDIACRVYHGPAFRMVVDLAEPDRLHFVIAGGNGGNAGSAYATNQYAKWLAGEYFDVRLKRSEIDVDQHLQF